MIEYVVTSKKTSILYVETPVNNNQLRLKMLQWTTSSEENVLLTSLHFISPEEFTQCNRELWYCVWNTESIFFWK